MGLFTNKYPYTDFHEMNLDFVLDTISKLQSDMKDFIKYNEIKFHDPIEWDITNQYTSNTVITNLGVAYLSKQAVPSGIDITNELYWLPIGIFNVSIDTFRANITVYNEAANNRASRNYEVGDIIWWHDNLYYVVDDIVTGDALNLGNLEITNVAKELQREIEIRESAINQEVTDRNNAIESAINQEVTDRNDAIESAINQEVTDRNDAIADERIDINTMVSNLKIGDLKNVNANFPVNGQILKYDQSSATWVNANETGGGGSISSDIIAPEYDAETIYNPNDIVLYLGSLFIKIGTSEAGVTPSSGTSWSEIRIGNDLTHFHNLLSKCLRVYTKTIFFSDNIESHGFVVKDNINMDIPAGWKLISVVDVRAERYGQLAWQTSTFNTNGIVNGLFFSHSNVTASIGSTIFTVLLAKSELVY